MSSTNLPPNGSNGPAVPPGVPPQARPAAWPQVGSAPREARGVSSFVAIFLGILLVVSAGLNVLLLVLLVGGNLSGLGGDDDGTYEESFVTGAKSETAKVLQVPIHGAIAEGSSPVMGAAGGTVSLVRRALRQAAEDKDVVGVLLDIDSPGGGVTDSDEIYDLIQRFRRDHKEKPVMSLFGDMAASGGYYVAAASERIVARRTTITGSIGVIMSAWNFSEAAKKFGVEQVAIKSDRTPMKDILSPTRPMRDDERALLTGIVDELYDRFVTVVDEGREGMDRQQVLAVATGAVYTASQALKNGLIDEIGDRETALQWFEKKLGRPLKIVERHHRVGLADLLLGTRAQAPSVEQQLGRLLVGSTGPRFLYFWEGGR